MRIAVISSAEKDRGFAFTRTVCARLSGYRAEVLADIRNGAEIGLDGVSYLEESALYAAAEMIIAIGGDGAILHAAGYALARQTPILGVNTGRLGFMAGLEVDAPADLKRLFTGD